jgi:predicted dehydrogenase
MRFLVIGAGSMGQRRIRCLKALGYNDIIIWDVDKSKEEYVCDKYNVASSEVDVSDEGVFLLRPHGCYDAMIISTPPLTKQQFITIATAYKLPCFAEADVTTYKGNYTPSATLRFHPAIQKIKELLPELGRIYTFQYRMGQHLRDWHPGADYTNYYAAKKESGACREMFCFELSWLSYLFGTPENAKGFIDKKLDDPDISADDVYSCAVKFKESPPPPIAGLTRCWWDNFVTGTVLIDTVSRPAIRELHIVGEKGTLTWNWENSFVTVDKPNGLRITEAFDKGKAAEGYHSAICEEMYENELAAWIESLHGGTFPYTRAEEEAVIEMLKRVEG